MSALREAIEACLEENSTSGMRETNVYKTLVERLVEAVERVPHTVTIRDLSMTDPENVVTVSDPGSLRSIAAHANVAYIDSHPLHLTVDNGDLKVKIGNQSWSGPMRTEVYEG